MAIVVTSGLNDNWLHIITNEQENWLVTAVESGKSEFFSPSKNILLFFNADVHPVLWKREGQGMAKNSDH